jgi:hypothetical protein
LLGDLKSKALLPPVFTCREISGTEFESLELVISTTSGLLLFFSVFFFGVLLVELVLILLLHIVDLSLSILLSDHDTSLWVLITTFSRDFEDINLSSLELSTIEIDLDLESFTCLDGVRHDKLD